MDKIVIICQGAAGPFECNTVGQYLKSCDFEAFGGRGYVKFTTSLHDAMTFPTKGAAWEYWRSQSRTVPLRPDGKPNRPLTAYHVWIEELHEQVH
jgi:hypothetical protein